MSSEITYQQDPDPRPSMVSEQDIEEGFIEKLVGLKYTHRPDIRDRASLEKNFREKFKNLNRQFEKLGRETFKQRLVLTFDTCHHSQIGENRRTRPNVLARIGIAYSATKRPYLRNLMPV